MFNDIIKNKVLDINGVEIKTGQLVLVHQKEKKILAKVEEVFIDKPTKNHFGYWVDINDGNGIEGMMSYVLEVIKGEI